MRTRPCPCKECPWVRETVPGKFAAERYEALRSTTVQPDGGHAGFGAPMFACHLTEEGRELPCAGWLAAVGHESVTVRLLVVQGEIPPTALERGDGWPELYGSYDEMAAAMSAAQG